MPRHQRLEIPGAIYHVITRGIERRVIFKDNADRNEFLSRLSSCLESTGAQCLAWALLPNHFHLLIRTGVKPLSELMRRLLTGYALYFNHRHGRRGYLYQNRYKSVLCQEDAYFLELVRYIHLNPVRAKLINDMAALDAYPYSGHSVLIGKTKCPWQTTNEVLNQFGGSKSEAIRKYRNFTEEGLRAGKRDDLSGGGLRRSAGGWNGVHELRRRKDYWRGDERILGDGDFVNSVLKQWEEKLNRHDQLRREGWNIDRLLGYVAKLLNVKPGDILHRSRGTIVSRAREVVAYWGYREVGIESRQLCETLNMSRPALTVSIRRGEVYIKENALKLII